MMKTPSTLRDIYYENRQVYESLKVRVDELISSFRSPRWHFESRVKDLESFTLKMETGRHSKPARLEDFLACTIVVANLVEIKEAEELVCANFNLFERRPNSDAITTKSSDSFVFDDLRLYVKWRDGSASRPTGLEGILFEVQIKTFLQHAWSIATHDLTYKSDRKSWPKERIAFQTRAMLEHADTSIMEAEQLSNSPNLKKTDKLTQRISDIIDFNATTWPVGSLPSDQKRLAENISKLIDAIGISYLKFVQIIDSENSLGKGVNTLDLSPYGVIVQSLFNQEPNLMRDYLYKLNGDVKVYLYKEIAIPASIDQSKIKNAIIDTI